MIIIIFIVLNNNSRIISSYNSKVIMKKYLDLDIELKKLRNMKVIPMVTLPNNLKIETG